MTQSIIIIGAGISGLSAGCYAQMNGYKTLIFEMHDKPGGLCTSWMRNGYTFDGCIEWLLGSKAGTDINLMWRELGAVQDARFIDYDVFQRIQGSDGQSFSIYADLDRLEQHMKELSPADSAVIEELCNVGRRFTPFVDVGSPSTLLEGIKMSIRMLPFIGMMLKYGKITTEAFVARYRDPFLRKALLAFADVNGGTGLPVAGLMYTPAAMHIRNSGYPIGGSLAFAQAIERRYLDLGGQIHYGARVEKILVETDLADQNDKAVGVCLFDNSEHRADVVISAADGHATIFEMLAGRYASEKICASYEKQIIYPSWVQVSLGVSCNISEQSQTVSYLLDEPIDIAGAKVERIDIRHFCMDHSMAPPGKSTLIVRFMGNYAYWKALYNDPERYEAEKKEIARIVISQLQGFLPDISRKIEVVDVATPITVKRYTNNWQGSRMGWLITTDSIHTMTKGMDKVLPGLQGFYMCGQWVEPGGGLPTVAASGRGVVRMLCKKDRKKFKTSLPTIPCIRLPEENSQL